MQGKRIQEARKLQGLSQEELADRAQLSVRTLQRIENDASIPRGKTLNLLCDVLNLSIEEFTKNEDLKTRKDYGSNVLNFIFLVLLNLLFVTVFGYLTMDSSANFNSKIGAVFLGFFISYFIVSKTPEITGTERIVRYGIGLFAYFLLATFRHHFPASLLLGLYPSIAIYLSVLFYGKYLIAKN